MDSRVGDEIYIPAADRAALTLKTRILLALGCVDEDAPPSRGLCVYASINRTRFQSFSYSIRGAVAFPFWREVIWIHRGSIDRLAWREHFNRTAAAGVRHWLASRWRLHTETTALDGTWQIHFFHEPAERRVWSQKVTKIHARLVKIINCNFNVQL